MSFNNDYCSFYCNTETEITEKIFPQWKIVHFKKEET